MTTEKSSMQVRGLLVGCASRTQYSFSPACPLGACTAVCALTCVSRSHYVPSNPARSHPLTELRRNWMVPCCPSSVRGQAARRAPGTATSGLESQPITTIGDPLVNLHTAAQLAAVSPHNYVPQRPINSPPYDGFAPRSVRLDAFAAVLNGVELGEYDRRMVAWLVDVGDDPMCRAFASLMWRCRVAGVPASAEGGEA